jgi:hypothetical protein
MKWSETKTSFSLEDGLVFVIIERNMVMINYKIYWLSKLKISIQEEKLWELIKHLSYEFLKLNGKTFLLVTSSDLSFW